MRDDLPKGGQDLSTRGKEDEHLSRREVKIGILTIRGESVPKKTQKEKKSKVHRGRSKE